MVNEPGLLSMKEAQTRGSTLAQSKNHSIMVQCGGKEKDFLEEKKGR